MTRIEQQNSKEIQSSFYQGEFLTNEQKQYIASLAVGLVIGAAATFFFGPTAVPVAVASLYDPTRTIRDMTPVGTWYDPTQTIRDMTPFASTSA